MKTTLAIKSSVKIITCLYLDELIGINNKIKAKTRLVIHIILKYFLPLSISSFVMYFNIYPIGIDANNIKNAIKRLFINSLKQWSLKDFLNIISLIIKLK
ncbi:MAG: hypothetical protein QXH60_01105 [Candidatus Pacearchaeota archaeon]